MNQQSPTIFRAFGEKLPDSRQVTLPSNGYHTISGAAASTIDAEVVPVYFEKGIDTYQRLYKTYFEERISPARLSSEMPELETTHVLDNEADVLRLATLQLIHPVNIALQRICPAGTRIQCRSETQPSRMSRFDIEWSLWDASNTRFISRLAILELKRPNVISKDDFRRAAANERTWDSKMEMAMGGDGTLLEKNAILLSKQARKYSRNCPYVALFDWNAMFLFTFLPERAPNPLRGFYFDEGHGARDMTFRRLLFAFVARSLKQVEATRLSRTG